MGLFHSWGSFFRKSYSRVVCNFTKNVFLSKYFSRFLLSYLSRFFWQFRKVIFQKNLLVKAANRCNVFKIFILTKTIYSGPVTRVWENLRHLAFSVGVWLFWNGKRSMLFQIAVYSKTWPNNSLFMQLRRIQYPVKLLRLTAFVC